MCNFEMAVDDEKFFKYHSFLQMVDDTEEWSADERSSGNQEARDFVFVNTYLYL
jgi:hypothetical protein